MDILDIRTRSSRLGRAARTTPLKSHGPRDEHIPPGRIPLKDSRAQTPGLGAPPAQRGHKTVYLSREHSELSTKQQSIRQRQKPLLLWAPPQRAADVVRQALTLLNAVFHEPPTPLFGGVGFSSLERQIRSSSAVCILLDQPNLGTAFFIAGYARARRLPLLFLVELSVADARGDQIAGIDHVTLSPGRRRHPSLEYASPRAGARLLEIQALMLLLPTPERRVHELACEPRTGHPDVELPELLAKLVRSMFARRVWAHAPRAQRTWTSQSHPEQVAQDRRLAEDRRSANERPRGRNGV